MKRLLFLLLLFFLVAPAFSSDFGPEVDSILLELQIIRRENRLSIVELKSLKELNQELEINLKARKANEKAIKELLNQKDKKIKDSEILLQNLMNQRSELKADYQKTIEDLKALLKKLKRSETIITIETTVIAIETIAIAVLCFVISGLMSK